MADLLLLAALGTWLFFVFSVWQFVRLLGGWKPAAARVWHSDYSETQQREDFWSFGFTAFTSRGFNWRDGEDQRLIEDEIVFTDERGLEHRALIQRHVHRGWRPSSVYTVWYDPADPSRVTAKGPLHWTVMALLAVCAFAMIVRLFGAYDLPLPFGHG